MKSNDKFYAGEEPVKKNHKRQSTTAQTSTWLRKEGYRVANVEKFIRGPFPFKQDVFGFGDLLCFHPTRVKGATLVQCTDKKSEKSHMEKILTNRTAYEWLLAGNSLLLILWKKVSTTKGVIDTTKWFSPAEFDPTKFVDKVRKQRKVKP